MKNIILSMTALFLTLSISSQTIVDTAVSNKDFSTLVTALKAADLVGALSGEGPFTVFAPNNAAFGKIDSETLGSLLKPENVKALSNILKPPLQTMAAVDTKNWSLLPVHTLVFVDRMFFSFVGGFRG